MMGGPSRSTRGRAASHGVRRTGGAVHLHETLAGASSADAGRAPTAGYRPAPLDGSPVTVITRLPFLCASSKYRVVQAQPRFREKRDHGCTEEKNKEALCPLRLRGSTSSPIDPAPACAQRTGSRGVLQATRR